MEAHKSFRQDTGSALRGCVSLTPQNDQLKVKDIISNYDRLKSTIAERHEPTAEHSIHVRILATSLGFACRLAGNELTTLSIAAEIHDIGKLQMPIAVLEKKGPLSSDEWSVIRRHPAWGARIAAFSFPSVQEVSQCVIMHHERMDGSGYPNGLSGNEIPMLARVLAVADAFSALTEDRPFRPAYSEMEALRILMHEEADKYDGYVVEVLARSRLSRM